MVVVRCVIIVVICNEVSRVDKFVDELLLNCIAHFGWIPAHNLLQVHLTNLYLLHGVVTTINVLVLFFSLNRKKNA